MTGSLNHLVGIEKVTDMHRAAERSRLVAETRAGRPDEASAPKAAARRNWLLVRRRIKLA
jgi:hypothetical protein